MSHIKTPYITETTPPGMRSQILVACRLAHRFAARAPTPDELRRAFGMSRSTAYRWVSAIKEARLLEGAGQ